jgi:hypothetical protein
VTTKWLALSSVGKTLDTGNSEVDTYVGENGQIIVTITISPRTAARIMTQVGRSFTPADVVILARYVQRVFAKTSSTTVTRIKETYAERGRREDVLRVARFKDLR